jgi:hypothetical protein
VLCALAVACGGVTTVPDGETHFLSCAVQADCLRLGANYQCIDKVCVAVDAATSPGPMATDATASSRTAVPDAQRGGGAPDAASGVITLRGTLGDEARPGGAAPLAGAAVCVVDRAGKPDPSIPCVTTDTQGHFLLGGLPKHTQLLVSFAKPGYGTVIRALDASATDLEFLELPGLGKWMTASKPQNPAWDPRVAVDPSLGALEGLVAFRAATGGSGAFGHGLDWALDVAVSIAPAAGDGPFYEGADGKFVANATGTRGQGAWFVNLPAGEYEVTFASATLDCRAMASGLYGFPGGLHSVRVPVVAGTTTQGVGVLCR